MTQLLCVMENWTKWLDISKCIDNMFLDFEKAFDSIRHKTLLTKLPAYEITGKTADWSRYQLSSTP